MRRRAFTLMEMVVVIFVIATIAMMVVPNMAASVKNNRRTEYIEAIQRLPAAAAQVARETGSPVDLVASEEGSFRLEQTPAGEAEPSVIRQVEAIPGMTPSRFETAAGEAGAGEWAVRFFPDGASDQGGVELTDSGETWALSVDARSKGNLIRGDLPPIEESRWSAGDYVRRS